MFKTEWCARQLRAMLACGALALASACASQKEQPYELLPFHVAVVPIDGSVIEPNSSAEVTPDSHVVELVSEQISNAVTSSLNGPCFTVATLLRPPSDDASGAGADGAGPIPDQYWIEQAEAVGADLLLEFESLRYDPIVVHEKVGFFSSNVPLFLIGGPFLYLFDDMSYDVNARLRANLYDLSAILAEEDGTRRIRREFILQALEAEPDPVELKFPERASDNPGKWYSYSILVPTGTLATWNDVVRSAVAGEAIESMARGLADDIQDSAQSIIEPDRRLARFYLDPKATSLEESGDGTTTFSGEVVLHTGRNVRELADCWILAGGQSYPVTATALSSGEDGTRYALAASLPLGEAAARLVQVRVTDAGTIPITRSWTMARPVPKAEAD